MEALLFSARLRINDDIEKETLEAYVDEVMDLVELTSIRKIIVSAFQSFNFVPCCLHYYACIVAMSGRD